MEEDTELLEVIDSTEQMERCQECGHAWISDEPVHYADCRFFMLDEQLEDDEEQDAEVMGWKTFRPALL